MANDSEPMTMIDGAKARRQTRWWCQAVTWLAAWCAGWHWCAAQAAAPVVSNVTAAQRPGTVLVDIGYDVAVEGDKVEPRVVGAVGETTHQVEVAVSVSLDGGGVLRGADERAEG